MGIKKWFNVYIHILRKILITWHLVLVHGETREKM